MENWFAFEIEGQPNEGYAQEDCLVNLFPGGPWAGLLLVGEAVVPLTPAKTANLSGR